MTEKQQAGLLVMIYAFLKKNKVYDNIPMGDLLKDLYYLHKKGWLYVTIVNGRVEVAVAMYRIPEFKPEIVDKYPEKEEGNILYIPFMASEAVSKIKPLRYLRSFLKKNPDIKQVIFDRDKKVKIHNIKEKSDERRQTRTAVNA